MKNKVLIIVTAMLLCLSGCGSNWIGFMASDESDEACTYQVSSDLDSDNFDAVLGSECADDMQKGAAYFGKAGYDINDVISGFVEASSSTQSDPLNVYMSTLTKNVTSNVLSNLSKAKKQYTAAGASVNFPVEQQKDANFYAALVSAVRSLSLMKILMDANGDGLLSGCDNNGNLVPDDADAMSCSLTANGASGVCNGATYTTTGAINIKDSSGNPVPNLTTIYNGVAITVTGTATASCPSQYKKIRALSSDGTWYYLSTTMSGEGCTGYTVGSGTNAGTWPCPIIDDNGAPLGLAEALTQSMNDSTNALALSLGASGNDVSTAINAINSGACGTDAVCSESEISSYIQTMSK